MIFAPRFGIGLLILAASILPIRCPGLRKKFATLLGGGRSGSSSDLSIHGSKHNDGLNSVGEACGPPPSKTEKSKYPDHPYFHRGSYAYCNAVLDWVLRRKDLTYPYMFYKDGDNFKLCGKEAIDVPTKLATIAVRHHGGAPHYSFQTPTGIVEKASLKEISEQFGSHVNGKDAGAILSEDKTTFLRPENLVSQDMILESCMRMYLEPLLPSH